MKEGISFQSWETYLEPTNLLHVFVCHPKNSVFKIRTNLKKLPLVWGCISGKNPIWLIGS